MLLCLKAIVLMLDERYHVSCTLGLQLGWNIISALIATTVNLELSLVIEILSNQSIYIAKKPKNKNKKQKMLK